MDRKLARKNLRSGLIAGAICARHVRAHVRGGRDLRPSVNDSEHPTQAPPAGEQLHLPGPSIKPFMTAIAITLIVIGTTINIILSIVGLIALVIIVADVDRGHPARHRRAP